MKTTETKTPKAKFLKREIPQYLSDAKHHIEIHNDKKAATNILNWVLKNAESPEARKMLSEIKD
jgi:hypothetical protein